MEIKLYLPSQKRVDEAKEIGIDLIETLKIIANYTIKDGLDGGLKWISLDVDEKRCEQLKEYGIDVPSQYTDAYAGEIIHSLDMEYVKDGKEIKLDVVDIESIKNVLNNIEQSTVVTNAQIASILQDMKGFEITPLTNNDLTSPRIYTVGKYKDIEVKVDPYMPWNDCRIICI